ncbi:MAG: DnaA ATPase domain-containing protein [Desulfomonilaceae bacterium]
MNQLALPFNTPPRMTFDTLVLHEGIQAAVAMVRNIYGNREKPFPSLFLYGPEGTGKTHIITAVAALLKNRSFSIHTVGEMAVPGVFPHNRRTLKDLVLKIDEEPSKMCCIVFDDIHLIQDQDHTDLWNLFNKMDRIGAPILLAAHASAEEIFPHNAHLRSRINSGLVFHLDPPQDQDRILILDKMARDRSIRVPQEISNYLVTRKTRNIKELAAVLEILDQTSLELKRRVTLPLIKMLEADGKI